jgi:hypothetical protein
VRVTIPRFSLSHDKFQAADSAKYLIFSTRQFEVPRDRPVTFAVDLAVRNVGGEPGDYRRAMAAFQVFDLAVSQRVFSVCGTATRVFALDEQLGAWEAGEPFIYMVESPYEDFDDDFTRLRTCELTLDRSRSTAAWHVDGHRVPDPRHLHPPTRWHRVRYLDDRANPGRSQPLTRRAGHHCAVAPVPPTRRRRVSLGFGESSPFSSGLEITPRLSTSLVTTPGAELGVPRRGGRPANSLGAFGWTLFGQSLVAVRPDTGLVDDNITADDRTMERRGS